MDAFLLAERPDEPLTQRDITRLTFEALRVLNVNATSDPRRKALIDSLPTLREEDLAKLSEQDSSCPICLNSFLALLAAEEMALAMDSPAVASQDLGVTRLVDTCGHIFCRKDISTWIREDNDSCPTCRRRYIVASAEPTNQPDEHDNRTVRLSHFVRDSELNAINFPQPFRGLSSPMSESAPQVETRNDDMQEYTGMYS